MCLYMHVCVCGCMLVYMHACIDALAEVALMYLVDTGKC